MTLDKRLFAGCGTLLLLTVAFMATSLWSISRLATQVKTTVDREANKIGLVGALLRDTTDMDASQRSTAWRASMKDSEGVQKNVESFNEAYHKSVEDLHGIQALLQSEEEVKASDLTMSLVNRWRDGFEQFNQQCAKSYDAEKINQCVDQQLLPLMDQSDTSCEALAALERDFMNQAKAEASTRSLRAKWTAVGFFVPCLVIGFALFWMIANISTTLRKNADDLSSEAEQVASAAQQVSVTSMTLAKDTTQQAAMIEETSAAAHEISSMAQRNTENCLAIATMVDTSQRSFMKTNDLLDGLLEAMGGIDTSSKKISKIIKVIDDIAFQTNILALNAAVEAARAGESGMGFAVVADEVRSLAQRSATASKDTALLIEDSIDKSSRGKLSVDEVAGAIRTIASDSSKMKLLVDEIHLGSAEQAKGLSQITSSIGQMERLTQSIAASSEESAAASKELSAQAESMQSIVDQIESLVGGDTDGIAQGTTLTSRGALSVRISKSRVQAS